MIPRWLVDKRLQICAQCEQATECTVRFRLLEDAPNCPLKRLANREEEVAARAWPAGAESVSGCCDSALNYLS
jgi:hypothetical protein